MLAVLALEMCRRLRLRTEWWAPDQAGSPGLLWCSMLPVHTGAPSTRLWVQRGGEAAPGASVGRKHYEAVPQPFPMCLQASFAIGYDSYPSTPTQVPNDPLSLKVSYCSPFSISDLEFTSLLLRRLHCWIWEGLAKTHGGPLGSGCRIEVHAGKQGVVGLRS